VKRVFSFTKEKFLSLTDRQRQKKCAELLLECLSNPSGHERLLSHYKELLLWMQKKLSRDDVKTLSDQLFIHQQMAGMTQKEYDLPEVSRFDKKEGAPFLPITIYLENLRSLHNIGSILRTCEAFRLGKVFFSGSYSLEKEKLKKSAMGTQQLVEICHTSDASCLPRPIIALETCPKSTPYYDCNYPDSFTLALGNETYGITDTFLQKADFVIHIPLFGQKNSLNVSNAFSIVCADIVRKKRFE